MGTVPETRNAIRHLTCPGTHEHGRLKIVLRKKHGFESRNMATYPPGLTDPWAEGVRAFHIRLLDQARECKGEAARPRYGLSATTEMVATAFRTRFPPGGAYGERGNLLVDRGHRRRSLHDGGGLCSPGVVPPESRTAHPVGDKMFAILEETATSTGLQAAIQELVDTGAPQSDQAERIISLPMSTGVVEPHPGPYPQPPQTDLRHQLPCRAARTGPMAMEAPRRPGRSLARPGPRSASVLCKWGQGWAWRQHSPATEMYGKRPRPRRTRTLTKRTPITGPRPRT